MYIKAKPYGAQICNGYLCCSRLVSYSQPYLFHGFNIFLQEHWNPLESCLVFLKNVFFLPEELTVLCQASSRHAHKSFLRHHILSKKKKKKKSICLCQVVLQLFFFLNQPIKIHSQDSNCAERRTSGHDMFL